MELKPVPAHVIKPGDVIIFTGIDSDACSPEALPDYKRMADNLRKVTGASYIVFMTDDVDIESVTTPEFLGRFKEALRDFNNGNS